MSFLYSHRMRLYLLSACIMATAIALGWTVEAKTIVDSAQREVQIPGRISRIVGLGPGTLRTLVYLGVADKIIGVEGMEKKSKSARAYWLAHPEFAALPVVGPGGPAGINKEPDLEVLLRLKPDVVFVSYMETENADKLQQKLGFPIVLLSAGGSLSDFESTLRNSLLTAGKVLDRTQRAEKVMQFIEMTKADVAKRISLTPARQTPSAYVGCVGFRGLHGIESSESQYPPFLWTGIRAFTDGLKAAGHLSVDKELLLKWNPELIFIDVSGLRVLRDDYSKNRDYYLGLTAFQTKRVYPLYPLNAFAVNAGNALVNAYAVGKIAFPKQFEDISLAAKADEIYSFLVGKPVYQGMVECWGPLAEPLILD
ncbi:MAG: iron ABC transporter substrate-binding protein [Desulfomonilaceae bacterium]